VDNNNDDDNDDTCDNNNPPAILSGKLVGNEDEDSEEETMGNESTGVQDYEIPGVPSNEDNPGASNDIADDATGEQVNANGEEEDEVEPDAAEDVANEDEVDPNADTYNPDT
jgi:hypothetical protein